MLGIAPRQVVIGSEIKEYWHLGNIKRVARNSTWRLLRKDSEQRMQATFLQATAGRKRVLLIASEASQHKCCFLYPPWNFKIFLAQEWALGFGWTMVVPRVVPQHRVSHLWPLTWTEDQSVHHQTRAKPEEIWCPPLHTCEAKAPVYPGLWADASGVKECSLSPAKIFTPISTPLSSTFAVKAQALSGPALFPQLLCQFKDPDVWSLIQSFAGATGSGSRPGMGMVHMVSPGLPSDPQGGGEWHKRLLSRGCSNSSWGMKLAHHCRTMGSSLYIGRMRIISLFSQTKACFHNFCSSTLPHK